MAGRIEIKQGAKLTVEAAMRFANGTLMTDLQAGWISSQVRNTSDVLVGSLTWTVPSSGIARGTADTTGWAVGTHRCDIRVARPDGTMISETVDLRVLAAVTR